MPQFNSLDKLLNYIQQQVQDAMQNEVAEEVVEVMTEDGGTIDKTVYNAYTPYNLAGTDHHYHRTYQLKDPNNFSKEMIDENTLAVRSTRSEGDRDIAEVIESGVGYDWGLNSGYVRDLDKEIGARPFHEATVEELQSTGKHVEALKRGLEKRLGKGTVE